MLRVELEAWDGRTAWAEYDTFRSDFCIQTRIININSGIQIRFDILNIDKTLRVEGEDQEYKLHIGGYRGNAGDSMADHNGMKFTTQDRDNDKHTSLNCADVHKGGWWFNV